MSQPLLSIEALSAISTRDGGQPVLRDVDLTLKRGEVRGLVGESGAGKSTVAKAVLGILPSTVKLTGGWVRFEGQDLMQMKRAAFSALLGRDITLIPQDPQTALNPARSIEAQLTDGLRLKLGLSRTAARARALELMDEVQIRDPARVLAAYPHQLSGGMRQRILIAAAFAPEPKLVVADEPTTALDVTVQKEILRLIRRMQEAHGTAVIFVTHDLGVVAKICDSVTLLYAGKVIEDGPTARLLNALRHAYTRALLSAGPRYDRPDAGLEPVPEAVFAQLRAEIGLSQSNSEGPRS
ncbi:ABC transporter ATP-binding protein [Xaviernesmea oryzae]|uniref:ABC transporter ATP-binding protein n=1 Tax=Xaviernesmea oryzae TaxID=464029 RepID=A0A1Q9B198_9HYPH|nr:ABC transporter ATP-binding protein [Xaviernesmea oryzae]OLP61788.1 ABC transporter ATP-binding protein [Xaviernesmea oryzae]SEL77364.1 peptide/nickel transport system ATP-binding protein [Xaviernesmea oryzae]